MKALPPEIQHAVKYGVRPTNIHHDPMSLYIEQFSSKWILPTPINATAIAMHTTGLFKGKAKKNRFPVPLSSSYYMVSIKDSVYYGKCKLVDFEIFILPSFPLILVFHCFKITSNKIIFFFNVI